MAAAASLRCPECRGSRLVRAGVGPLGGVGWVCPAHPTAGALDLHDMAAGLAATGRVAYGEAIALLRVEILGLSLGGDRG